MCDECEAVFRKYQREHDDLVRGHGKQDVLARLAGFEVPRPAAHDEIGCFIELSKARALAMIIVEKSDKIHDLYERQCDTPDDRLLDLEEHAIALAARFHAIRLKTKYHV